MKSFLQCGFVVASVLCIGIVGWSQDDGPKKKPDLGKEIEDALKQLENPAPQANPEAPVEPQRKPMLQGQGAGPLNGLIRPGMRRAVTPEDVIRDLENVARNFQALSDVLEKLEQPGNEGAAFDMLFKQMIEINPRMGEIDPGIDGLLKQIDVLGKLQGPNANAPQLLQQQLQNLLKRRVGPAAAIDRVPPARLGVRLQIPSELLVEQLNLNPGQGLIILSVVPDSAAAKAGLRAYDVLLEIDGKVVPSEIEAFQNLLRDVKADQPTNITILRKGQKETIKGVTF